MAIGRSGRIVVVLDDERLKTNLHVRLAEERRTVKEWVTEQVRKYLKEPKRKNKQ